jgi:hypothetical protein
MIAGALTYVLFILFLIIKEEKNDLKKHNAH